jgi:NAD+ synthetase
MVFNLCQIDTVVGDFKHNTEAILNCVLKNKSHDQNQIYIFPELTLIGYPPLDLLDNHFFIEEQSKYIREILNSTEQCQSLIIFGYAEKNEGVGKRLFNSAVVCHQGKIIYNYRKRLLPTYDVFDEARYFEPGKKTGLFHFKNKRIGLVICEDLWFDDKIYTVNVAEELFLAKADFIISMNASPSVVGKYQQKVDMIKTISKKYCMPIIYVNQVGGNDDIVFDGNSFVTNKRGIVIEHANKFEEHTISVSEDNLDYHVFGIPLTGVAIDNFVDDAQFFYQQAICGIRSYITKCGFNGVVIGESGGIDSAVVTALAVDAIGSDKVVAITMPSQYSSEGSYKDSEILCKNLGVKIFTYQIKEAFDTILNNFNGVFDKADEGLMEENLQARIRGQLLMSFSNRYGHLVLSTGNKSEMSVGYCTVGGDMMGGLAPISDLYKMEVYAVAKYINKLKGKETIPQVIIDKEPSAELAPNQKDVDSLPPYPILDTILKLFIEGDVLSNEERFKCEEIVRSNYGYVDKVLRLVRKAEFKRRQSAITIKMHQKAFGYGRRIPIAQKWNLTLGEHDA